MLAFVVSNIAKGTNITSNPKLFIQPDTEVEK